MSSSFHSVRDLHTNYLLPAPFAGTIAYLPFQIEEYFGDSEPRCLMSHPLEGYCAAGFQDDRIGTTLGADDNDGAGGANVWSVDQVHGTSGAVVHVDARPIHNGEPVAARTVAI